jgi:hypothetical protein
MVGESLDARRQRVSAAGTDPNGSYRVSIRRAWLVNERQAQNDSMITALVSGA